MAALTIDFNRILYRVHVVCVVHGGFEKKSHSMRHKSALLRLYTRNGRDWCRLTSTIEKVRIFAVYGERLWLWENDLWLMINASIDTSMYHGKTGNYYGTHQWQKVKKVKASRCGDRRTFFVLANVHSRRLTRRRRRRHRARIHRSIELSASTWSYL